MSRSDPSPHRGRSCQRSPPLTGLDGTVSHEQLVAHLRHLDALVVVDNAEHVVATCRQVVSDALRGSEGLRFLVTSRTPIGISNESVWRLRGLDTTPTGGLGLSPAAEALVRRLRRFEPSFAATTENVETLNEIAASVDGVPLALVLVAAWIPAMSLGSVLDASSGLQGSHTMASRRPSRPATGCSSGMDAASLDAMSVFSGSFDLDAVGSVVLPLGDERADEGDAIGTMSRLIEASLVETHRSAGGDLRYRLLVPIREFALARLDMVTEDRVRDRHLSHFARRVVDLGERAWSSPEAMRAIESEIANLRGAMEWAEVRGDGRTMADVAAALTPYWFGRFLALEGLDWLERSERVEPGCLGAEHLWVRGFLRHLVNDPLGSVGAFSHALDVLEQGNEDLRARILFGYGRAELFRVPGPDPRARIEEAIEIWERLGTVSHHRAEAHILLGMRGVRRGLGAGGHLDAAAAILDQNPSQRLMSTVLRYRSLEAWMSDDLHGAVELARQSVAQAETSGDSARIAGAHLQLVLALASVGEVMAAAASALRGLETVSESTDYDIAQVIWATVHLFMVVDDRVTARRSLDFVDAAHASALHSTIDDDLRVTRSWRRALSDIPSEPQIDPLPRIRERLEELAEVGGHARA